MRFIRDIISERAEAKAHQSDTAPAPRPISRDRAEQDQLVAENAPMPAVRPVTPRVVGSGTPDRTLTRLSAPVALEEDDVFKRLLNEDGAQGNALAMADPEPDPVAGDDDNFFSKWDQAPDAEVAPDSVDTDFARLPDLDPVEEPDPLPMPTSAPSEIGHMPGRSATVAEAASLDRDGPLDLAPHATDTAPPMPSFDAPVEEPEPAAQPASVVSVPAPASGRSGRSAGRVKTRLLGFGTPEAAPRDPFSQPVAPKPEAQEAPSTMFPVGWLVVISGPGRGASFPLHSGVSQIGRGEDQAIRLDFGDTSISRSNHAAIAYDEEHDSFYLGHGGKANMVRLNDRPVLSTEDIKNGALIRIGETTLRFVALCDGTFNWSKDGV